LSPSRRTFLQQASAFSLLCGAAPTLAQQVTKESMAAMAPLPPKFAPVKLPPMLHCLSLAPFVDPLPLPARLHPRHGKIHIAMREVHAKVHRDVAPTRLWAYTDASDPNPSAIAPVLESRSNKPLQVEWSNHLPTQHFLPIDHSLHQCGPGFPDVRAVVHLHGGRTPPKSDGYPTDWFVPGQSRTCAYPLKQDSATLWFHDHAMGINRLNIYAGLFGMALVRDQTEDALDLPSGPYELPLMLYDRNFTAAGQLFYPTSGDPEHPWVPEFYADGILINGKIRPFVDVEPGLYRLRILNAANSRFFNLALSNSQPLHQIGSDQGLLAAPVALPTLLLAPAERADILIDLSGSAGQNVHLLNAGFPILQFRVASKPATASPTRSIPTRLATVARIPESTAVTNRIITLNEYQNASALPMIMLLNRKHWHEPVTERPRLNTTEIWEFINLTEDTHPMHLHLVRFQVLDRRIFEPFSYLMYKRLDFRGPATPPEPNELGWKDVVQCPPATITRILVPFDGYTGNYLYHCHILEHESNDMMRPFEVIA
jgi:spore coat protein A